MKPIVLAICGASGSVYGVRLLEVLIAAGREVHLTISRAATEVFRAELGIKIDLENFEIRDLLAARNPNFGPRGRDEAFGEEVDKAIEAGRLVYHSGNDYSAGIASGSFRTAGMAICPCSMGTLGSLAGGLSSNLIHRAAGVHLKERRKLILVPRETPLSGIQLGNMKTLSDAGAVILPAMPGFYHQPACIDDLIDFVVARVCDQLDVDASLMKRWGE
ncbi:UbiX family flavin prenyltransferase [Stratiformator vulcanicus]|uniref:Flavin prenyltransferase UbiX n=1 Tax=Stratiformator vulcanicus TaxID=2527980 RepID=A0A517R3T7_9PLAN|nr:flavin prenyltransferase UbiX [Stratiformator vulcanicus]QDT38517.1 putative aromatic acid decarboxylase [Stratiformator vulcanicus]